MPVAAGEVADGQRLVQQLIEGAPKERQLDWLAVQAVGDKGARELGKAFRCYKTAESERYDRQMEEAQTGRE